MTDPNPCFSNPKLLVDILFEFRQGYRLEDIDFDIEKPLKQTLTPEPGRYETDR